MTMKLREYADARGCGHTAVDMQRVTRPDVGNPRDVWKIRDWANESIRNDWQGFSESADMRLLFCDSPLSRGAKLPLAWRRSTCAPEEQPAKRRRDEPRSEENYPREIALLQGHLIQLYDERRKTCSGDAPWTGDTEWIFKTWHSLVKKHNKRAKLIAEPEIRGPFTWSYVRQMEIDLNLQSRCDSFSDRRPC